MPGSDPKFKLGDRVTVAAVLRRQLDLDWNRKGRDIWDQYGKVWRRVHPKRQHGIVVGKRTLSDGTSNGNVETWRRYTETRRYSAYVVAFNLSARHEYVLPEDLAPDRGDGAVIATDLDRELLVDREIIDAEIVEDPNVPF